MLTKELLKNGRRVDFYESLEKLRDVLSLVMLDHPAGDSFEIAGSWEDEEQIVYELDIFGRRLSVAYKLRIASEEDVKAWGIRKAEIATVLKNFVKKMLK